MTSSARSFFGNATAALRNAFAWFAVALATAAALAVETAPKVAFDIPAGNAITSLRRFSSQARVQVIFLEDAIDGVSTKPIKGEFAPADAIERMLAGTGLKVSRDEVSGAFAVSPDTTKEKGAKLPNVARAAWAAAPVRPIDNPAGDEPITLTPFEVSTARDVGFVASQSLAGGRLAAELKDTPAAYSVMTREFIDALNIIDLTEANEWMVNATSNADRGSGEIIGDVVQINSRGVSANNPSRNFFLLPVNFDSYNLERYDFSRGPNAILFGESTFGGSSNVVTKTARTDRAFGNAKLTFSSWNSVRSTLDVNAPLKQDAAVRFNGLLQSNGGWRDFEFDRKRAASLDTLWRPFRNTEVRVEGEYGHIERNKPMTPLNDFMTGWDGVTTYTTLQTSAPPAAKGLTRYGNSTTPYFLFANGLGMTTAGNFANTARTFGGGSSSNVPVGGVVQVGSDAINIYQRPMNEALNVPASRFDKLYAATSFRLPPRDFAVSTNEPTTTQRYEILSLFVRQRVGERLFVEVAGNLSRENRVNNYVNYRGMNNIVMDVNANLPDGSPNPRFLEAYSDASGSRLRLGNEYKNLRVAAAYSLNNTRVGDFTLSAHGGIAPTTTYQYIESLRVIPEPSDLRSAYTAGANVNTVMYRFYLSERDRPIIIPTEAVYTMNDNKGAPAVRRPVRWMGDASRETDESITTRTQKFAQTALKAVFFGNRLHLLGAARRDELTIHRKVNLGFSKYPEDWDGQTYYFRPDAPPDYEELTYLIKNAAGVVTNPTPQEAITRPAGAQYANDRFRNDYNPRDIHSKASSYSMGGVLHVTSWASVFANQATSFLPTSNSRDVNGDFIGGPKSKGYDAGVRLSFLNNAVYVSASRYAGDETAQIYEVSDQTRYIRDIARANKEGDYTSELNQRGLLEPRSQVQDTRDRKNRGYELELTANFTRNWRMIFNAARPEGWQFNNSPILTEYLRKNDGLIRGVLADAGVTVDSNNRAAVRADVDPANQQESQDAADGWNKLEIWKKTLVSGEQPINRCVKYTVNINTDYRFSQGPLAGLRIGGGVRFRGPQVIGYRGADTIPDPANPLRAIDDPTVDAYTPVWAPSFHLVALSANYTLRLENRRTLAFQLNIENLLNDTGPRFYNANIQRPPGGDLTNPSRVTTPVDFSYEVPRSFRFSTTLSF